MGATEVKRPSHKNGGTRIFRKGHTKRWRIFAAPSAPLSISSYIMHSIFYFVFTNNFLENLQYLHDSIRKSSTNVRCFNGTLLFILYLRSTKVLSLLFFTRWGHNLNICSNTIKCKKVVSHNVLFFSTKWYKIDVSCLR